MARKRSAHLLRVTVEGISTFSPYKGGQLTYLREYDPNPMISTDLTTKIDIERGLSRYCINVGNYQSKRYRCFGM